MNISFWLLALYTIDRLWKTKLIFSFIRSESSLAHWPSVTVLSPVTRGWCHLVENLESRRVQDYPAPLQHVVMLDRDDLKSQELIPIEERVLVDPDGSGIASKPAKLTSGLKNAKGEVLVFVDDDIHLPPNALRRLVSALEPSETGATFGLAYAPRRDNTATRLLSAFINGNAAFSYLTLASLMEPYTITGHIFCIPSDAFHKIGGLSNMEGRLDDDHELARRLRLKGWSCRQTAVTYELHNRLENWSDYIEQMRRWFIIPKTTMAPDLSLRERFLSSFVVAGALLPTLLLLTGDLKALFLFATIHIVTHSLVCQKVYSRPADDYGFLLLSAFLAPLQVLHAWLFSRREFTWRGRHWRL